MYPVWLGKFIIHGFASDKDSDINQSIKEAYLKVGTFNVIVVDWSPCWNRLFYGDSAKNTEIVGVTIARFAKFLHFDPVRQFSYDDMYIIGHSLGAHVAGYAGRYLKPDLFNTIYALDPAGPKFLNRSIDCRIDATDAKYVESIQTSIHLGYDKPIGKAAFYPNYGKGDSKDCTERIVCPHSKAYIYFAASILSPGHFKGFQCESYRDIQNDACTETGETTYMGGEPANHTKQGIFYVQIPETKSEVMRQIFCGLDTEKIASTTPFDI